MIKALNALEVITLFAENVPATKAFYTDVFGLPVVYQDDVSAVVRLGNVLINVLQISEAPQLVEPVGIGGAEAGPRQLFTIKVSDVDAVAAELEQRGVMLLNGAVDHPWGRRTAAFADPASNVWEAAQDLSSGT